jgi:hypothetical protein
MVNTKMDNIATSGVAVKARYVTFQHCSFKCIETHGLRVVAEHFVMANSSVLGYAKGFAFDVQARVVAFVHNKFSYLETLAFFAVRKLEGLEEQMNRTW